MRIQPNHCKRLDGLHYPPMQAAMRPDEPKNTTFASSSQHPLLGIALRLAAMAVLGIMFALVKLAGAHGVHVAESLFYRQLAGLPVAVAWLWWTGALASIRTSRPMEHGLRMILGVSAMTLNFSAMLLLPMAEATTFGFAAQIFATILAALLLREPTGRYRWGAVALGFIGVMVALQPSGQTIAFTGALVALGGALMTACVIIQIRRMAQSEPAGAIVFWFSLTSLVPLGAAVLLFGKNHDLASWTIIAGLSLSGAIAQILLTASLRHASVAAIMTMDYSALLWSALMGYAVFGDIPGHSVWLGAPLIIGAGMIIAWREQRLARRRAMIAAEYPVG
jgi:drug/metabolite transporter (DMT)-like permease